MSLGECERVVVKSVCSVLLRLPPQYSVFRLVYVSAFVHAIPIIYTYVAMYIRMYNNLCSTLNES